MEAAGDAGRGSRRVIRESRFPPPPHEEILEAAGKCFAASAQHLGGYAWRTRSVAARSAPAVAWDLGGDQCHWLYIDA